MAEPATIDRFACAANAQLGLYNTMLHEPGSGGVDAFAQRNYLEHVNYMFPPVVLLPRVVKLLTEGWPNARAIVIFPRWTTQPWFAPLLRMCNVAYVLPVSGSALFEKVHQMPHHAPVRHESW